MGEKSDAVPTNNEMYDIVKRAKEEENPELILNWINSNGGLDLSDKLDELDAHSEIRIPNFSRVKNPEGETNFLPLAAIGFVSLILVIGKFLSIHKD